MYIIFYVPAPRIQCQNPFRFNVGIGYRASLAAIYSLYGEYEYAINYTNHETMHKEEPYSNVNYLDFLTESEQNDYNRAQTIIDEEVQYEIAATFRSKDANPGHFHINFDDPHTYSMDHAMLYRPDGEKLLETPFLNYEHTVETKLDGRPWTKKNVTS